MVLVLSACSNGNSSGLYNEEETANQDGDRVEDTTIYFNYQTYMDRTPTTRWSKQETELFYEVYFCVRMVIISPHLAYVCNFVFHLFLVLFPFRVELLCTRL